MFKSLLLVVVSMVVIGLAPAPGAMADGRFAPPDAFDGLDTGFSGGFAPTPNLPRGAQLQDQSAFAMGSMQWNVVFIQNDGSVGGAETWDAGELTLMQTKISAAKTYWEGLTSGFHPGAQLSINVNYVNGGTPMTTSVDPTANQNETWVNPIMNGLGYNSANRYENVRNFNQDQRVAANTHWSTTIFVMDNTDRFDASYAYAYFGGPFTILTQDPAGWTPDNFNMVLAHEMGHIFMANDEYAASGRRTTHTGGYLNGFNGNAELDGSGSPVIPPQPNALMLNNGDFFTHVPFSPSSFASVQFGHRDTDNDSIPDILDTHPTLTGNSAGSNTLTGDFVFTGSISVNDIDNLNVLNVGFSNSQSDMTINTIADLLYILDGGTPTSTVAVDGNYDDYTESLSFLLAGLAPGSHTIDVYGLNSVDNESNLLSFTFNVIPEPSTFALAMLGLLSVVASRRRRR